MSCGGGRADFSPGWWMEALFHRSLCLTSDISLAACWELAGSAHAVQLWPAGEIPLSSTIPLQFPGAVCSTMSKRLNLLAAGQWLSHLCQWARLPTYTLGFAMPHHYIGNVLECSDREDISKCQTPQLVAWEWRVKIESLAWYPIYHLQISGTRFTSECMGPGSDIVDDGSVKPWKHEMGSFLINLQIWQALVKIFAGSLTNLVVEVPECR